MEPQHRTHNPPRDSGGFEYPLQGYINLEGFWNWNVDEDQLVFAPRTLSLLGFDYEVGEPRLMKLEEYLAMVHPEDREDFRLDIQAHLDNTTPVFDNIHRIGRKEDENEVRWIHCMGMATRDADGRPRIVTGSIGDITGRKQTERSLDESRRFIQGITEAMPAVLYTYDYQDQRITYINAQSEEILGYKPEEILRLGRNFLAEVLTPQAYDQLQGSDNRYTDAKSDILESEVHVRRRDGDWVWLSVREIVFSRDSEGVPLQILGTAQDITRRKDAEVDLLQEKEWQAVTLRAIGDGVITTDRLGRILFMNQAARDLCGFASLPEAAGRIVDEIYTLIDERSGKELLCPVRSALRTGEVIEYFGDMRMLTEDGRKPFVSLSANLIYGEEEKILGAVAVLRDETEKVRAERELRKMQALDSLGLLAGGIAHDFNNIMTAIQNNISLARLHTNDPEVLSHRLQEAENACDRVRGLTQQLLTFARGGAPIKKTTSIAELIRETADFVLRGSRVSILYDIADNLWPADVDENQLSSVINNLVINAVHAMPDGGRVAVRCRNRFHGEIGEDFPFEEWPAALHQKHYVEVVVRDEGKGIAPENLERIFDPYFTTKETGTGLGLSSTYSIIKKHEGIIGVSSVLNQGTTFSIFLPARPGAAVAGTPEPVAEPGGANDTGRILLMDDEEDIRETLSLLLDRLGYEVAEADEGSKAVAMFEEAILHSRPFDVVIVDLTVPGGMGGLEAAQKMRASAPAHTKFVVSSGYSNDPVLADFESYGFHGGVAKPFRIKDLNGLLRKLMEKES